MIAPPGYRAASASLQAIEFIPGMTLAQYVETKVRGRLLAASDCCCPRASA